MAPPTLLGVAAIDIREGVANLEELAAPPPTKLIFPAAAKLVLWLMDLRPYPEPLAVEAGAGVTKLLAAGVLEVRGLLTGVVDGRRDRLAGGGFSSDLASILDGSNGLFCAEAPTSEGGRRLRLAGGAFLTAPVDACVTGVDATNGFLGFKGGTPLCAANKRLGTSTFFRSTTAALLDGGLAADGVPTAFLPGVPA